MKLNKRDFDDVDFTNRMDVENFMLTEEVIRLRAELKRAENTIKGLCDTIAGQKSVMVNVSGIDGNIEKQTTGGTNSTNNVGDNCRSKNS